MWRIFYCLVFQEEILPLISVIFTDSYAKNSARICGEKLAQTEMNEMIYSSKWRANNTVQQRAISGCFCEKKSVWICVICEKI
jgi:hypothetical protein